MSTRGFVTFVEGGIEKTAYNHSDSYPSGLGRDVLSWLRFAAQDVPTLREKVKTLRVVDDSTPPTDEDVNRLAQFADLNVSGRDPREWYVLLRETQGNPGRMLQAGVIEDASEFPTDSSFAEYGYVVDLDAETFEVYEGFQRQPHSKGRFSGRPSADRADSVVAAYYPVALIKSWPLAELPTCDEFVAAFEGYE